MQGGVGDLAPPSVMSKIHCLMELSGLLVTWGGGGGGGGGEWGSRGGFPWSAVVGICRQETGVHCTGPPSDIGLGHRLSVWLPSPSLDHFSFSFTAGPTFYPFEQINF